MVSIIAAVAQNGVIGHRNKLIWHLSADLKRFKQLTMGHHLIMGRKTFDSIGRPLPGRITVLITRNKDLVVEGCLMAHSLDEAITLCRHDTEPFIAGGGEIYAQAMPVADRIYLTRIHHSFEGDTYFPEIKEDDWEAGPEEYHAADENNPWAYSLLTLNRKK